MQRLKIRIWLKDMPSMPPKSSGSRSRRAEKSSRPSCIPEIGVSFLPLVMDLALLSGLLPLLGPRAVADGDIGFRVDGLAMFRVRA